MADIYEEKKDLVIENEKILDICDFAEETYSSDHETNDANETSDPILPQLRALDAIKPHDEGFLMALAGGVTTAVICPGDDNLIGGVCAAVKTAGKTVSEMTMVPELAFHMCLTDGVRSTYSGKQAPKTRMASASLIREILMKAKHYHTKWAASKEDSESKPPKFDMKLHSLMHVFDGMPAKIQRTVIKIL